MRLIVLFALTAGVVVATTADASAIGKRKRRGNDAACCPSSGGGYAAGYGGYGGVPAPMPAPGCSSCGVAVGGYQPAFAPGFAGGVAGGCYDAGGAMLMPAPGAGIYVTPAAGTTGRPVVLPAGGVVTPGTNPGTGTSDRVPDPMPGK